MNKNGKKTILTLVGILSVLLIVSLSIFVGYSISMATNKIIHENISYSKLEKIKVILPDEIVNEKLNLSTSSLRVKANAMAINKIKKEDISYIKLSYSANNKSEEYEVYYGVDSFKTNHLPSEYMNSSEKLEVYKSIDIKSYNQNVNYYIIFFEKNDSLYEFSFNLNIGGTVEEAKAMENLLALCKNVIDKF